MDAPVMIPETTNKWGTHIGGTRGGKRKYLPPTKRGDLAWSSADAESELRLANDLFAARALVRSLQYDSDMLSLVCIP
jgi:hypothetical protein